MELATATTTGVAATVATTATQLGLSVGVRNQGLFQLGTLSKERNSPRMTVKQRNQKSRAQRKAAPTRTYFQGVARKIPFLSVRIMYGPTAEAIPLMTR